MKKIIALLLALICMVSLFACGDNDEDDTVLQGIIKSFDETIASGGATSTKITFTSADGKVSETFTAGLYDSTDEKKSVLKVPNFEYVTVEKGEIVLPESYNGTTNANPESSSTAINLAGLNFKSAYFKDNTYTYEDRKFHTTITDCSGFFGVNLTQSEVDITITMANNMPKKVLMEYTTALGYLVKIEMKYDY